MGAADGSSAPTPFAPPPTPGEAGPSPSAPRWSRGRRRTIGLGVAAIVVVVLLLAATYELGIGPFHRGGTGASEPMTYENALSTAAAAAEGYRGGGWSVIAAASYTSAQAFSVPINLTGLAGVSANCTSVVISHASSVDAAAVSSGAGSGIGSVWLFLFKNVSSAVLVVTVSAGVATLEEALGGNAQCTLGTALAFITAIPVGIPDSPAISANVAAAGGAAFLAAHPDANATAFVHGALSVLGVFSLPLEWTITYSACPPSLASVTLQEPMFNATVDAASGTVLSHSESTRNCTSIGSLFSLPNLSSTGTFGSLLRPGASILGARSDTRIGP